MILQSVTPFIFLLLPNPSLLAFGLVVLRALVVLRPKSADCPVLDRLRRLEDVEIVVSWIGPLRLACVALTSLIDVMAMRRDLFS